MVAAPSRRAQAPTVTVALIIPTIGRPTLRNTLNSLIGQPWRDGDEIIVVGDGHQPEARRIWHEYHGLLPMSRYLPVPGPSHDYGHTPRNLVMPLVQATHIAALDDDDIWVTGQTPDEWSLAIIRKELEADPHLPHLFAMAYHKLTGNLSSGAGTPMFVCPNDPKRLSIYNPWYGGDGDFIKATMAFYGNCPQHTGKVVAIIRPREE